MYSVNHAITSIIDAMPYRCTTSFAAFASWALRVSHMSKKLNQEDMIDDRKFLMLCAEYGLISILLDVMELNAILKHHMRLSSLTVLYGSTDY